MTALYMAGERETKDTLKTHIQKICTHTFKLMWEFCQNIKKTLGELKYKQKVECCVRKYCHKENRSATKHLYVESIKLILI